MIKNIGFLIVTLLLYLTQAQAGYTQVVPATLINTNTPTSAQTTNFACTTDYERTLQQDAVNALGPGKDIINGIFTNVNTILSSIGQTMFNNIATNKDYKIAVATAVFLYVLVYGILISFNMASFQTAEVTSRLIKIAIVLACLSPNAWALFNYFFATPLLNIINGMITSFSTAANVNGGTAAISNAMGTATGTGANATVTPTLNPIAMTMLMGPMTLMYSLTFVVMIVTLLCTGFFGWVYAFFLIWGLIEFTTMIIAAIVTYIKAMIALTFLFSLAPIFFAFLLFERTRQIFKGWLNQVLGFAIQPILLFAFLGFYGQMLLEVLQDVMFVPGVLYCKRKFVSLGIVDIYWWRPVIGNATGDGDYNPAGPAPVHIESILLALATFTLGKNMEGFLKSIGETFTGGSGNAELRGSQVGRTISNHIPFVQGRGPGGVIVDSAGWAGDKIQQTWNNRNSQKRADTTRNTTSHEYADADSKGKNSNRGGGNTNRQGTNRQVNNTSGDYDNSSSQSQNRQSQAHFFSDAGGSDDKGANNGNTETTVQQAKNEQNNTKKSGDSGNNDKG